MRAVESFIKHKSIFMKQLARKHTKSIYILTWKFNLKKKSQKTLQRDFNPIGISKEMELLITAKYETNIGHLWSGLKRDAAFFILFFW